MNSQHLSKLVMASCAIWWVNVGLIPTRISNHMPIKVWGEITYPFPNLDDYTAQVWEYKIPYYIIGVITCLCQD